MLPWPIHLHYEISSDKLTRSPRFIHSNQVTEDPVLQAVLMQRLRWADADAEGQLILKEDVVTSEVVDADNLTCAYE